MTAPDPVFGHLLSMTDHRATYEHALLAERRREDGYCTDDMARVLVVATREPETPGPLNGLAGKALTFLNDAQAYNGSCRNRMDRHGNWPTSRPPRTPGAAASGRSARPPRTATSAWFAGWPSSSSTAPPRPGRRTAGDGVRRDRRRRTRSPSSPCTGGLTAPHRLRRRVAQSTRRPRMAVAGAAPHLRQRRAARGDDRRGVRAGTPGADADAASTSWTGCSTTRRPTVISRRHLSRVSGPQTSGRH